MSGFIEAIEHNQITLFPERLDDWICEDNSVRIVDVFVEVLDLVECVFERTTPARTGRPGYEPAVLLKLFIYGYLNRVPSSRRQEREAGRNVELMCAISTGRCTTCFKFLCWGLVLQGLSGPLAELACDSVEFSLTKAGCINVLGEVLA